MAGLDISHLEMLQVIHNRQKGILNDSATRKQLQFVDDGETGAGMVILRVMQTYDVTNCIVVVTRWFGGVKLMGDRFKHLQNATRHALDNLS